MPTENFKRNIGKHTDTRQIRTRILRSLDAAGDRPQPPSALGRCAYPDYDFKRPQGAAFSVAKVLSSLRDEGLIKRPGDYSATGYMLTQKGRAFLRELSTWSGPIPAANGVSDDPQA